MESIGTEAARNIVAIYRGWNELHRGQLQDDEPEIPVVDVLLVPEVAPAEFTSMRQVENALETQLECLPEDEPDREYIVNKLLGSLALLHVAKGKEMDFGEYVQRTMGVTPREVPEESINSLRENLEGVLGTMGLHFDPADKQKFERQLGIRSDRTLQTLVQQETKRTLARLGQYVPLPTERVQPTLEDGGDVWAAYLGSTPHGNLFLKISNNGTLTWTKGELALTVGHEYGGHFLHFLAWREAMRNGTLSAVAGVITFHTLECTQAEAVAQYVPHLILGEDRSPEVEYALLYDEYKTAVSSNVHYFINRGVPEAEVLQYAVERLFLENPQQMQGLLTLRRDHPMLRAYLACYQPARDMLAPLQGLPFEQQRNALQQLYTKVLTPIQIQQLVQA
jgi:hypothetical protein